MRKADNSSILSLRIGVKSDNDNEFSNKLHQMSTPGNIQYGMHLSQRELPALLAPHSSSVETLNAWISSI